MSLHNLDGVSVLMSVKIDSRERLRNLQLVLDYYRAFFTGLEIILVEQDQQSRVPPALVSGQDVRHYYLRSDDVHWKTRNYNYAARMSSGEFLLMADCDIFMQPDAMVEAYARLEKWQPLCTGF